MASGTIDVLPRRQFAPGERITTAKLNDLGNPVVRVGENAITARELADGQITADKLDIDVQGQLGVPDGSVTTNKLVTNAVTGPKIADETITGGKLSAEVIHGRDEKTDLLDTDELMLWDSAVGEQDLKKVVIGRLFRPGAIIQSAQAVYSLLSSLTDQITLGASAPAATDGTVILSITITPTSTASKFRLRFTGCAVSVSADVPIVVAAFRGSTCLGVSFTTVNAPTSRLQNLATEFFDAPATLATVTYQINVGPGASGTVRFNSQFGSVQFGSGMMTSKLVIEEIKG